MATQDQTTKMRCARCSKPAKLTIQNRDFCRAECAYNHFDTERFCAINGYHAARSAVEHSYQVRRAEAAEEIIDALVATASALAQ